MSSSRDRQNKIQKILWEMADSDDERVRDFGVRIRKALIEDSYCPICGKLLSVKPSSFFETREKAEKERKEMEWVLSTFLAFPCEENIDPEFRRNKRVRECEHCADYVGPVRRDHLYSKCYGIMKARRIIKRFIKG